MSKFFSHFLAIVLLVTSAHTVIKSQNNAAVDSLVVPPAREIAKSDRRTQIQIAINASDTLALANLDSVFTAIDSMLYPEKYGYGIYGHSMLKNDSIRVFQEGAIVKVPDEYILGERDEISISIFGPSQFDAKYEIDAGGFIDPQGLPKILLKGLTWGQAKKLIKSRFYNYYVFRNEQFALSLSQPRSITVNVFGEVAYPGSYQLVATNTAFNALIAAGGPTDRASVRNIMVVNGVETKVLDIYELINNPSTQFDFFLQDNVIIQVPSAEKIVSIKGAVSRPLMYELKANEGLTALINYAGGLAPNAVQEVIQVKRFADDRQMLIDVNLKELMAKRQDFSLIAGDEILIKAINTTLSNAVSIEGAVELPGEYALETAGSISALVARAVLKREARLDVAFLMRANPDSTYQLVQIDLANILANVGGPQDLKLKALDKLIINDLSNYSDKATIAVKGAVRKEVEYPFDPEATITLNRAILLAGGLAPDASDVGYIIRTNLNNKRERSYVRISPVSAANDPASKDNIILQPLDEVLVFAAPNFTDTAMVVIKGEVRMPGEFYYNDALSLQDLLTLGGGLGPNASGILDVYRLEKNKNQATKVNVIPIELDENLSIIKGGDFTLMPYDEIVARRIPDFEEQIYVTLEGEVRVPGEYALITQNERLANLIQRAGGYTDEAFIEGIKIRRIGRIDSVYSESLDQFVMVPVRYDIVTEMSKVNGGASMDYNNLLKKGDIIIIPKKEDLVYLDVRNTRAYELYAAKYSTSNGLIGVPYVSGKSAKWYINNYVGGFGELAAKKKVTVQDANGAIRKTKTFGPLCKFPKPMKGSVIAIGAKTKSAIHQSDQHNSITYPNLKKGVVVNIGQDGEKVTVQNQEEDNQ